MSLVQPYGPDFSLRNVDSSDQAGGVLSFGDTSQDYIDSYSDDNLPDPISLSERTPRLLDSVDWSKYAHLAHVSVPQDDWNAKAYLVSSVGGKLWLVPVALTAGFLLGLTCWLMGMTFLKVYLEGRRQPKKTLQAPHGDVGPSWPNRQHMFPTSPSSGKLSDSEAPIALVPINAVPQPPISTTLLFLHKEDSVTLSGSSVDSQGVSCSPGNSSPRSLTNSSVISVQSVVHQADEDD